MDEKEKRFWKHFGHSLFMLRKNTNITRPELAKSIKMSPVSVINIECGRHRVNFYKTTQILKALGCKQSDLSKQLKGATP